MASWDWKITQPGSPDRTLHIRRMGPRIFVTPYVPFSGMNEFLFSPHEGSDKLPAAPNSGPAITHNFAEASRVLGELYEPGLVASLIQTESGHKVLHVFPTRRRLSKIRLYTQTPARMILDEVVLGLFYPFNLESSGGGFVWESVDPLWAGSLIGGGGTFRFERDGSTRSFEYTSVFSTLRMHVVKTAKYGAAKFPEVIDLQIGNEPHIRLEMQNFKLRGLDSIGVPAGTQVFDHRFAETDPKTGQLKSVEYPWDGFLRKAPAQPDITKKTKQSGFPWKETGLAALFVVLIGGAGFSVMKAASQKREKRTRVS